MGLLFAIPIFIFAGIELTYPLSIFAVMLGSLQVIPSIYYLSAMKEEEVSRVAALECLYLILVFLGAAILLGDFNLEDI